MDWHAWEKIRAPREADRLLWEKVVMDVRNPETGLREQWSKIVDRVERLKPRDAEQGARTLLERPWDVEVRAWVNRAIAASYHGRMGLTPAEHTIGHNVTVRLDDNGGPNGQVTQVGGQVFRAFAASEDLRDAFLLLLNETPGVPPPETMGLPKDETWRRLGGLLREACHQRALEVHGVSMMEEVFEGTLTLKVMDAGDAYELFGGTRTKP